MNMSHVNERRDFFGHVVHQVLMLYVPDMSSPSHVAPSLPAALDIDRRSRGDDRLDPMVRAGSCSQVQVGGGVVMAALAGGAKNNKPPARALIKTATRDPMGVLPLMLVT